MNDEKLRQELIKYLEHGHAHVPLSKIVKDMPEDLMNKEVQGLPYTAWQLLEHIRISQWDMVDFTLNPNYKELEWPKDYWPKSKATKQVWDDCYKAYEEDLLKLVRVVQDSKTDLFAPIPWGSGQTVMKEVLQIIDHASYHAGELLMLRRLLGAWEK